jgi:hypothetical protein
LASSAAGATVVADVNLRVAEETMSEQTGLADAPVRQAAEDQAVIEHLVKTFHADPAPAPKPFHRDEVASRIRRQWTPESRAMLAVML